MKHPLLITGAWFAAALFVPSFAVAQLPPLSAADADLPPRFSATTTPSSAGDSSPSMPCGRIKSRYW